MTILSTIAYAARDLTGCIPYVHARRQARIRAAFMAYLEEKETSYEHDGGTLTVHGDIHVTSAEVPEIPAHMTVQGSLYIDTRAVSRLPEGLTVHRLLHIKNTCITALPRRLLVMGELSLVGTHITHWPQSLCTVGHLTLNRCRIRDLPRGLNVMGDLDLDFTPIENLPEGLRVRGTLNLRGTCVRTFPKDMTVGRRIIPSARIGDIPAFFKTQGMRVARFSLKGSMHQRLSVQAHLQLFPDLWRIVQSTPSGHELVIVTYDNQNYDTSFQPCPQE